MECGALTYDVKCKCSTLEQLKTDIMDTIHDRINTEIEDQICQDVEIRFKLTNFLRGIYYLTLAKYLDPKAYRIAQKVLQRIHVKQTSDC